MVLGHCTRPLRVPLEDHIRTCAPLLAFASALCARQPICAGRWPRQNPPSGHSLISIHARGRLHIVFAMFLQVGTVGSMCPRRTGDPLAPWMHFFNFGAPCETSVHFQNFGAPCNQNQPKEWQPGAPKFSPQKRDCPQIEVPFHLNLGTVPNLRLSLF